MLVPCLCHQHAETPPIGWAAGHPACHALPATPQCTQTPQHQHTTTASVWQPTPVIEALLRAHHMLGCCTLSGRRPVLSPAGVLVCDQVPARSSGCCHLLAQGCVRPHDLMTLPTEISLRTCTCFQTFCLPTGCRCRATWHASPMGICSTRLPL